MTVVGCVVEPRAPYLEQAQRLVRSWRACAGPYADLPWQVVTIGALPAAWLARYQALDVTVHEATRVSERHGPSNKLRLLEIPEVRDASRVVLLDCDTVVVQPPHALMRGDGLSAKPADLRTVAPEAFDRLFAAFGVPQPAASMPCSVTGELTVPYFNAGVLSFGRDAVVRLIPEWLRLNHALLSRLHLLAPHEYFCDQASLSLAVAASGIAVTRLGLEMNFPAHLTPRADDAAFARTDPVVIHYHHLVTPDGALSPSPYPAVDARIAALNAALAPAGAAAPVVAHERSGHTGPLLILGMHRSGTSLAAALLESAGLAIGDRLVDANPSNPRGHFEDLDFVELDRDLLVAAGVHQDGWVAGPVPPVDAAWQARAAALVARKTTGRPWGWKDPRAVPLLDVWLRAVPDATFAIVYRAPWEVAESLFRRGDEAFAADPGLAIAVWQAYNERLLALVRSAPERCVVASVDTIAACPDAWVHEVASRLALPLGAPGAAVVERPLLHGHDAAHRAALVAAHYPEALQLFQRLEDLAFRHSGAPSAHHRPPDLAPSAQRELALRDWHAAASIAPLRRAVARQASNTGWCACCQGESRFIVRGEWLRDQYVCERCGSIPRFRAVNLVIERCCPGWMQAVVHEYAPTTAFVAAHCAHYTSTRPFDGLPAGASRDLVRSAGLEQLPLASDSVDVFVTQDVFEHVFDPFAATREILRVLRPGGVHVFTTPKHRGLAACRQRARITDGAVEHLLEAQYHGDPERPDRELVTWDFGDDFEERLILASHAATTTHLIRDRHFGLDGEFLEVFVTRKPLSL